MIKIRATRSAPRTAGCAANCAEAHAEAAGGASSAKRRQTMQEGNTTFVGLDVHKDSIAIAAAQSDREAPRFVGTVGPDLKHLRKALWSLGSPQSLKVVYEAGPCGFGLARQ